MRSIARALLAVGCTAILIAVSACSASTSPAASSTSPSAKVSEGPTGKLDPAVKLPSGFPADVPVYTGARLTSQATFTSNGQVTWALVWETLDSVDKVQAFYVAQLNQADWTSTFSGTTNGTYSVFFTRKSVSKVAGILAVDGSTGVTKISLAYSNG